MATFRIAFIGFRHGHIFDLYARAAAHPQLTVVGAAEDDDATRETLAKEGKVKLTHRDPMALIHETQADIIAIGDYYGRRGALALAALRAGKHVIADKPLCTSLKELADIVSLTRDQRLKVGCMFDMRDNGNMIALRQAAAEIGEVHAASFAGQHPLMFGRRPGWYFEDGKQGGTINDIAIHALDLIPWVTGLPWAEVIAARSWHAAASAPDFQDGAQLMMRLSNGAGVIGDVSYLMPEGPAYGHPGYWRINLWGTQGMAETAIGAPGVQLYTHKAKEARLIPKAEGRPGGYLDDFVADVAGSPRAHGLHTQVVLTATRAGLLAQHAADTNTARLLLHG